jgi:hypothetical protein
MEGSFRRNPVSDFLSLFYAKDLKIKKYNDSDYMVDKDNFVVDENDYVYETERQEKSMYDNVI